MFARIIRILPSFLLVFSSDAFTRSRRFVRKEPAYSGNVHQSRYFPLFTQSQEQLGVHIAELRSSNNDNTPTIQAGANRQNTTEGSGVDIIFNAVDTDGSGTIDPEEYERHLSSAGYSADVIESSFQEMDTDKNGEISRDEFRRAIIDASNNKNTAKKKEDECPMGYFLNSVRQTYEPLGPLGRVSQRLETLGPFKKASKTISNLFGVDKEKISKLGISFLLSYSVVSNINGALSLSVAWYMSVKRTGLSPLVPGQWKSLLSSYAMIYGAIQLLKPFRVAAAIAMSKLSAEYLEITQSRLNCSRSVAAGCQFMMGIVMMGVTAFTGINIVSVLTGVPVMGTG